LDIFRCMGGNSGGDQQIASRIANSEIDMLLFFRDPTNTDKSGVDDATLLRLCDVHNVPVATNIATAEVLIHAIERGDLSWRDTVMTTKRRPIDFYN
ncbi:MAG: methylglyoxal synthase, partial [Eubacteriales bacterium]